MGFLQVNFKLDSIHRYEYNVNGRLLLMQRTTQISVTKWNIGSSERKKSQTVIRGSWEGVSAEYIPHRCRSQAVFVHSHNPFVIGKVKTDSRWRWKSRKIQMSGYGSIWFLSSICGCEHNKLHWRCLSISNSPLLYRLFQLQHSSFIATRIYLFIGRRCKQRRYVTGIINSTKEVLKYHCRLVLHWQWVVLKWYTKVQTSYCQGRVKGTL